MARELKGIDTTTSQQSYRKDMTSTPEKIGKFFKSKDATLYLPLPLIAGFIFPAIFEITIIISLLLYSISLKTKHTLPFKKPITSKEEEDENELHPATDLPDKPQGITFFGNEKDTKKEIWFTNSDVRTHCLIFGTTGAGKTESLLSIATNSLNQCSGFIFIDGKGDNGLWAKVFSLVAAYGRLDDLYLINYMTASVKLDELGDQLITNTVNPFSSGTDDSLTELVNSLLSGKEDIWKSRAQSFVSLLMRVLVYLRDKGELQLNADVIREHFELQTLIDLANRRDIPKDKHDGLVNYLINLPSCIYKANADGTYTINDSNNQGEKVSEQHGYITMQFQETFGLFCDSYAHMMRTQNAEIDFYDVVVNRRILVVLLPSLEKAPSSTRNLGRIIISSIKQMMSVTLGSMVEGDVDEVIESKPTNAPSPYLTIFDEYGYYAVEGAAVMPAQARSLGFFMIFAGQDYQAFKKGSEEEAASIVANCAIKICMKLEDPTETLKIFQSAAGQEKVIEQSSFEKDSSGLNSVYKATNNASVSEKNIISERDLRDQAAGEAHMLFKDNTKRVKMFYAAPKPLKITRVNSFLEVKPPLFNEIEEYKRNVNSFEEMEDNMQNHFNEKGKTEWEQKVENTIIKESSQELNKLFGAIRLTESGVDGTIKYLFDADIEDEKVISEYQSNTVYYRVNRPTIVTKSAITESEVDEDFDDEDFDDYIAEETAQSEEQEPLDLEF